MIHGWLRRPRRRELVERLGPFRPTTVARRRIRLSARADATLKGDISGPPKSPTCCPVRTAAAPLRRRSKFASVLSDAPHDLFWRSRI